MSLDEKNFLVGINHLWFKNEYDHDFGKNQFSISRIFPSASSDLKKPDEAPDIPILTNDSRTLEDLFEDLSSKNIHLVRILVFERFEGIIFDDSKNIIGIDEHLINNFKNLFDIAKQHNVMIYLCLQDTWSIYDEKTPNGTNQQDYLKIQETWQDIMKNIITNPIIRQQFLNHAVKPLLNAIDKTSLFGVDLINEPEGLLKSNSIRISDVKQYLKHSSEFIHDNFSIKVSCGFQKCCTLENNADELSNYLDFFDFHKYHESGDLDDCDKTLLLGKTCLIGECGFPVEKGTNYREKNRYSTESFLKNAHKSGYWGALPWYFDYDNSCEILELTSEFSKTNPKVQKIPGMHITRRKECFVATVVYGEKHYKTQILRDFRDDILLKKRSGKFFVKTYYFISPRLIPFLNRSKFLRIITTCFLNFFVNNIKNSKFMTMCEKKNYPSYKRDN